jgi:hypothetical protein
MAGHEHDEGFAIWADWLISGDAPPVPKGPTPTPTWMKIAIHSIEGVAIAFLLWANYEWVWKTWRRHRQIGTDALMIGGWFIAFRLCDPWENYTRIVYSYNANFINLGCPQCHTLGWNSPNPNHMAEPLLYIGGWLSGSSVPRDSLQLLGDAQSQSPVPPHGRVSEVL